MFGTSHPRRRLAAATAAHTWLSALLYGTLAYSAVSEVAPVLTPDIVASWPHDPADFTQGLLFVGNQLYESTGLYGRSAIAQRDLYQREAFNKRLLPRTRFGEGLAQLGERLVQLTWRAGEAYVYDQNLRLLDTWRYDGEGWGLTTMPIARDDAEPQPSESKVSEASGPNEADEGYELVRSDGSHRLFVHRADDFAIARIIPVFDGDREIDNLNELEWIEGLIYANIWRTRRIAVIDPSTGHVVRWLDLSGLDDSSNARGDRSLNGIAWHAGKRQLLVTGKQWGAMYEIRDPGLNRESAADGSELLPADSP